MLDVGNFITELAVDQPRLALMAQKIVNAINQTANVLGVDSSSHASPPSNSKSKLPFFKSIFKTESGVF